MKIQVDELPDVDRKDFIIQVLASVNCNIKHSDIASFRSYVKKNEIVVSFHDPILRNTIIQNSRKYPVTFHIHECGGNRPPKFEIAHTKFCKFMLGVSKYESTTLVLGELGRYPIQLKAIRQTILYWQRLEQGTDNVLLQHAFSECKDNNYDWLKDIYHFLLHNGLGHIWNNIKNIKESYVKSKIDQRLRDQYNQYYMSYKRENMDRCGIVNICEQDDLYLKKDYLNVVTSPYVRSIITKLRIDAKKLNECRFRHYRKKSETSTCTYCGTPETVKHRLLSCRKGNLVDIRNTLLGQFRDFIPSRLLKDSDSLLSTILNVNPTCKKDIVNEMVGQICTFIKKTYEVE